MSVLAWGLGFSCRHWLIAAAERRALPAQAAEQLAILVAALENGDAVDSSLYTAKVPAPAEPQVALNEGAVGNTSTADVSAAGHHAGACPKADCCVLPRGAPSRGYLYSCCRSDVTRWACTHDCGNHVQKRAWLRCHTTD